MLILFRDRISNEKISQNVALPSFKRSFGRVHSLSLNKTRCSSRIFTIWIRVRGKLMLADLSFKIKINNMKNV
jgi:hypothetical protein